MVENNIIKETPLKILKKFKIKKKKKKEKADS